MFVLYLPPVDRRITERIHKHNYYNMNMAITIQKRGHTTPHLEKTTHVYTLHDQLDECFWILLLAESTVMNERTMLGAIR